MAKQSKRKYTKTVARPPTAQIKAIDKLIERGEFDSARDRLEPLFDKYPAYPPLLRRYLEVLLDLGETWRAGAVARKWTEIQPKSVLAWQHALESYLYNHLLLLAHEAAQQLHSLGEEIPPELLEIDENKALDKGPFGQVEWETLRRHELGLLWLHGNDFQKAVECLAEEPFPPSRNNYATALFHLGRVREALAVFFQIWQESTDNLYALQWTLQLRFFLGENFEAEGLTAPLRNTQPQRAEDAIAQLSGLLLLNENQAALDSYQQLTKLKWYTEEHFNPARLYHLAAVAAARLDKKKRAQSLWKKALKADPDFELAEENLDNLTLPQEQVRPPWAWPHHYQWFPQTFEQQLRRISRLQDNDTGMRKFLESANALGVHNRYLGLVCRQGDGVAYHLAQMILLQRLGDGDQNALEELKLLLTQEAGTDENRYQLAQTLISEGHLPAEQPLPLRIKGEVRDIRLFSFSIDDEPRPSGLLKKALGKMEQALDAIRSGNYSVAIDKLTALLKQFPRHPQILYNLAAAHFALKHNDQGEALLRQALEIQPDYLIARCSLAGLHLQRNQIDAAEELLQGLVEKKHLHISEACNLFGMMALVHQAKGDTAGVDSCLQMLESLVEQYPEPTEEHLDRLYAQLGRAPRAPRWLPRLFRGPG